MKILLLHYLPPGSAQTTIEHAGSLKAYSSHSVYEFDFYGKIPDTLDLNLFDCAVIHYSLIISWRRYINQESYDRLRAYKGLKVCFIQDEYRWVNQTVQALDELGIDILFTCVPEHEIEKVYPSQKLPNLKKIPTLTGYVEESLFQHTPEKPWAGRSIDVGYRSREVPFWLGDMGQDKTDIAKRFLQDAPRFDLNCNIHYREIDRLYGQKWIDFLCDCKAVLGVESGSSVVDLEGTIQKKVDDYIAENPQASYVQVKKLFFQDVDHKIKINAISPRVFEASTLKTLMILYEGDYSGVLIPWRHYVPLKKDHSNMAEVVSVLRNPPQAVEIIENCYREVACNPKYTYKTFVQEFDRFVEEGVKNKYVPQGVDSFFIADHMKDVADVVSDEPVDITKNFEKAQCQAQRRLFFFHLGLNIYLGVRRVYRLLLNILPVSLQGVIHNACKNTIYTLKRAVKKF